MGMDAVAVTVPAAAETGTVIVPAAIVPEVAKLILAPKVGTVMGNVEVVVNPAGRVPKETVGVAVVPVVMAYTVTKKESPGVTAGEAGLTLTVSIGVGVDPPPVPPPPSVPPPLPQPLNAPTIKMTTKGGKNNVFVHAIKAYFRDALLWAPSLPRGKSADLADAVQSLRHRPAMLGSGAFETSA